MIILYFQAFKVTSLALFLTLLFSNAKDLYYLHCCTLLVLALAYLFMDEGRRNLVKKNWMYFLMVTVFIDLWLGHLASILCFLSLRTYYILV